MYEAWSCLRLKSRMEQCVCVSPEWKLLKWWLQIMLTQWLETPGIVPEAPFVNSMKQMWEAESLRDLCGHTLPCGAVTSSPSLMNSFRQMWAMIPAARASPRTLIIVLNLSLTNDMVMVSWVHAYSFSTAVIKADCQFGCFYELTSSEV